MTEKKDNAPAVTVSEPNSDDMASRVRQLIGDGSARKFAQKSGIPPSSLQYVLEGGRTNVDNLVAIARAGGVSVDWLATGEGPMNPGAAVAAELQEAPAVYDADDLPDGFVLLPRYEVKAAAGSGALVHSEQIVDHLAFKRDWIVRQLRRNPANLILIEAMGDSMVPTIADRDLLLVDLGEASLRDNAIYALSLNGDVVVKRLERRMNGAVRVISDNRQRYSDYELNPVEAGELRIIGQVVWHGGSL